MIKRSVIFDYAKKEFGIIPDYPFYKFPHYAVLRHPDDGKWFGLVMDVAKNKLNLKGEGSVDIIDIKCETHKVDYLKSKSGFRPAYHMNKEHWLTVLLDGSVSTSEIFDLLNESYDLTK
ncbi:MmcQ/YjbR family DNA-binding protein [Dickeya dadantii]|uniref:MmcQ/YjbR family DNA-binding protein n=1 Tax=Dickeya dadantii TaxID=204038 RepID=UPI001495E2A5|nr:MmcQ/YjbR family DNA-binding protein [Dickeya dadantii]NPE51980.1 MmcQ/YjbR family DNA-binding protein [Dickeya dadantii]